MNEIQKVQEQITALQIDMLEYQKSNGFDSVPIFIQDRLDDIKIQIGNLNNKNNR